MLGVGADARINKRRYPVERCCPIRPGAVSGVARRKRSVDLARDATKSCVVADSQARRRCRVVRDRLEVTIGSIEHGSAFGLVSVGKPTDPADEASRRR